MDLYGGLMRHVCCPHCWRNCAPDEALWVSVHPDLAGDALLGFQHMRRFLPTRFTVEGYALDPKGAVCREIACPRCHLPMPRAVLEMDSLYTSIIGAPGCGKSYFLAAMTWMLRQTLPQYFEVEFRDADLTTNRNLIGYEESLFMNAQAQTPVLLNDLIRKTEEQGDQYDLVRYGEQTVLYPRPFLFTLQPLQGHLNAASRKKWARTLCLYDNAGESFSVGRDSPSNAVTQHLTRSNFLMFLFDPCQDPRFRSQLEGDQPLSTRFVGRQDTYLIEALNRIRRLTNLAQTERSSRPLIVAVTKYDMWRHLVDSAHACDPWRDKGGKYGLDIGAIGQRSQELRTMLKRMTPEMVGAAESLSDHVVYMAVSALGNQPIRDSSSGKSMIRPIDIQPVGVITPMLYGLYLKAVGLIQFIRPKGQQRMPVGNR
jgi:hypothetical protein